METWEVGEQVAVTGFRLKPKIHTITKITATQIVLDCGWRFRRKDNRMIGEKYNCSWRKIVKLTPELWDEAVHHELQERLNRIKWENISLETLVKVSKLVDEEIEKAKENTQ